MSTSWGLTLLADPTKNVGWSIATTGVFDIAVSEALARLVDPGDLVLDGGANVGYMSLLLSLAAGPNGKLHSFEPHPELFKVLVRNFESVRNAAPHQLHESALAETAGTAHLVVPSAFATNDGLSHLEQDLAMEGARVPVRVETIDDCLGADSAALLKLDVEGFEIHALRGAALALREQRIRHVVFEAHGGGNSDVVRYLQGFGYRVFSLGWAMNGPVLTPVEAGDLSLAYEAPSYVASVSPDVARSRMAPRGWRVLSRSFAGRSQR